MDAGSTGRARPDHDFPVISARGAWSWARQVVSLERVGTFVSIGLGGFLGANARYLAGLWALDRWGNGFPMGTLLVNVIGSFILGFYLTLTTERFVGRRATRLLVATGFLGAFTTFSTFSYEIVSLANGGDAAAAMVYVASSLALGLSGTIAGLLCAHAL